MIFFDTILSRGRQSPTPNVFVIRENTGDYNVMFADGVVQKITTKFDHITVRKVVAMTNLIQFSLYERWNDVVAKSHTAYVI